MRNAGRSFALFLSYALLWIANRWPAIRANTLFFDDFAVPANPAAYYIAPYRPVLWLEYKLWDALLPDFLWSHAPKILGALYTALAALALAKLLREWGVSAWLAASVPVVAIVNPVLADGALWNTVHALPLGVYFGIEAIRAKRTAVSVVFALLAACTYQVMIAIVAILAIAEPLIRQRFDARAMGKRIAVIAVAAALQIAIMLVIRNVYPGADARGLVQPASLAAFLADKWHGATNLLANGWMPVLAYYFGGLRAMSLWKWVPAVIALAAAIAVRRARIATAFATLLLLALPAAPILVSSHNPDAWRAAIPTAFALSVALVMPLAAMRRGVALAVVVALCAVMIPVSWYESQQRVVSFERDRAFVQRMREHWRGQPFRVGFGSPIAEDRRMGGPHDLTWGFQIRTPAMWTMFGFEDFARHYVADYHRIEWSPNRECETAPVTHHEEERVSVICGAGYLHIN